MIEAVEKLLARMSDLGAERFLLKETCTERQLEKPALLGITDCP